uniref:ATP synthase complex subunit 8 n=1 Tax=Anobiinae sp. GENSP01 TaxID=1205538 RepID=A0A0S2MN59_9COLE|nr:ATP synthase F0 subunit 8 [Anobiinae sp. GENSP01]
MPQMYPLNWLSLFVMFFIMFMMLNILYFYNFKYLPKSSKYSYKKLMINWKW